VRRRGTVPARRSMHPPLHRIGRCPPRAGRRLSD
jgi:hypothetical protein